MGKEKVPPVARKESKNPTGIDREMRDGRPTETPAKYKEQPLGRLSTDVKKKKEKKKRARMQGKQRLRRSKYGALNYDHAALHLTVVAHSP